MAHEKILLVEDHPANRRMVGLLLRSEGYLVWETTTAEEAFAILRGEPADLILMDIQLPGMDGLEATRQLKRDPATRHIPVVALTGSPVSADREGALAAGCIDYVTKPIDRTTFLELVRSHLGGVAK